nr:hypothetical protein [Pirellulaceae bacterium]
MMWQRVALCVAGLGAITVSAALADDTTPIANQDAPQGGFVAYLDDDPPDAQAPSAQAATAQAAGRVLRMLEILGVHRPQPMPAPVLAATDVPPPPASEAPPLETAAPFAYQEDAGRSLYEANAPGDDDRFPLVAASPDSSEPNEDWASSWQINDLRDPARTRTDWLHDEGLRDRVGLETDAVASSGEANAGPARQLANSATPAPPIRCPDGTKSSRRTFQQAGAGTNVAQAPAAEPPAVIAPAASEAPTATAAAAAAAPADFDPSPRSALSMTSLPPLPPLRSDAPFLEPRSVDAVLAPRPVPIVKSPPAARDGADVELAKTSDNVESKPTAMPSPKHRPSALPAPELPPQRVAASRRQPSSVAGGPARGVMLSQLPNMLRGLPPARKTDLPRQIALQSPPQSQSRLAPLPPQRLPRQTLT